MSLEDFQTLPPREGRRAGAILGLAVGDAVGATYEFCSPQEVPQGSLGMVGGGWLDLEPGETTDDTALTKAVLTGYGDGPLDPWRVRDTMLSWQDTLPKDIGNQTRKALDHLRRHPESLSLPEDPDAQGNGAVMRAAAHGAKATDSRVAAENAWTEAALTHPSWEARASSTLVAALVAYLIDGLRTDDALDASYALVEGREYSNITGFDPAVTLDVSGRLGSVSMSPGHVDPEEYHRGVAPEKVIEVLSEDLAASKVLAVGLLGHLNESPIRLDQIPSTDHGNPPNGFSCYGSPFRSKTRTCLISLYWRSFKVE